MKVNIYYFVLYILTLTHPNSLSDFSPWRLSCFPNETLQPVLKIVNCRLFKHDLEYVCLIYAFVKFLDKPLVHWSQPLEPMIGEIFGYNRMGSQCLQVQPVTRYI